MHASRDTFPILSRDASFQEAIKNAGETAVFLKRTMVEKNRESTTRMLGAAPVADKNIPRELLEEHGA